MENDELRELTDFELFDVLDVLGCTVDPGNGQAIIEIEIAEDQVAEAIDTTGSVDVDEVW